MRAKYGILLTYLWNRGFGGSNVGGCMAMVYNQTKDIRRTTTESGNWQTYPKAKGRTCLQWTMKFFIIVVAMEPFEYGWVDEILYLAST